MSSPDTAIFDRIEASNRLELVLLALRRDHSKSFAAAIAEADAVIAWSMKTPAPMEAKH